MADATRLFDTVLVRPPGDSYDECVSTNPAKNTIDVALAKEQHRDYISVLKESNIRVVQLPPLEDLPDSVFMQDAALLGSNTSVVCRFGEMRRRGEERALAKDLTRLDVKVGEIRSILEPGTLEGGDVLITDRGIFVGETKRTNLDGIRQLSRYLRGTQVTPVKTDLFHLLCGCTYLNSGKMLIVPEFVSGESFPGFEFVKIPRDEAYAVCALSLGEARVMIPSGFPRTTAALKAAGYSPVEVEMSEFYKGDGGVTCLCSPIYKIF